MDKKQIIMQVPFDGLSYSEALETLMGFLQSNNNHMVVTPNPEFLMMAKRDGDFLHILQKADLVLADGIGILLAARKLKLNIPERVPGCDITADLLKKAKGYDCFLLGAAPGVAKKARENLIKQGINVIGTHDGFFDEEAEKILLKELNQLKPDILIIGMGSPRQEKWLNRHFYNLPCKISICVGGSIDILAGNVRRAPKILRRMGLEWLYRLITNPSRAKRMLDLPRFAWEIFINN